MNWFPRNARSCVNTNEWLVRMPTAELTLQLPLDEVKFLEAYAQEHGTTPTEVLARYVHRLKNTQKRALHPDVLNITGLVPEHIDSKAEYLQHLRGKHQ